MKRFLIPAVTVFLAMTAVVGCARTYAPAPPSDYYGHSPRNPDVSYFYGALAPYGDWIQSDNYGVVWCPYGKQVDWRPYTDGQWVWTNYGWTWVANEDWGWATYHYGRWYDDPYNGWCWVPGGEWSPAWVAWREGGGWVGWAPLPPELTWHAEIGLSWNNWDRMPGVEQYWWSFCLERDLPGPQVYQRLAPRHRGVVLITETRNITNYIYIDSHVANRSLDVEPIRRAYGKNIAARRVDDLSAPPADNGRQLARDSYRAYRPQLSKSAAGARPPTVRQARPDPVRADRPIQLSRAEQQQMDRDAKALKNREIAAQKRMQQEQQQEVRRMPSGVDAEKLRQQHRNEQMALAEQAERNERVLRSQQEMKKQHGNQKGRQPSAKNDKQGSNNM